MKAYEFDRVSPHLYLGEIDASQDPFGPEVWRAPASSTMDKPPAAQSGHAVVRVGGEAGEWQQIEDHRGETGYTATGAAVEINAVGPIVDPVVTLTPPPGAHYTWAGAGWQPDIEAMRAAKVREIDAALDAAIAGGFDFNGVRYDSDAKSIVRISGAVTLSMLDPDFTTDWITYDNSVVTLDAAGLAGLGAAAGAHESVQIFHARSLKDQVLSATTPEEIAAIQW